MTSASFRGGAERGEGLPTNGGRENSGATQVEETQPKLSVGGARALHTSSVSTRRKLLLFGEVVLEGIGQKPGDFNLSQKLVNFARPLSIESFFGGVKSLVSSGGVGFEIL